MAPSLSQQSKYWSDSDGAAAKTGSQLPDSGRCRVLSFLSDRSLGWNPKSAIPEFQRGPEIRSRRSGSWAEIGNDAHLRNHRAGANRHPGWGKVALHLPYPRGPFPLRPMNRPFFPKNVAPVSLATDSRPQEQSH
jgi:hypothetical protein